MPTIFQISAAVDATEDAESFCLSRAVSGRACACAARVSKLTTMIFKNCLHARACGRRIYKVAFWVPKKYFVNG